MKVWAISIRFRIITVVDLEWLKIIISEIKVFECGDEINVANIFTKLKIRS